jgi:hypothetical protein
MLTILQVILALVTFIGAFTKQGRKATIFFFMSVRLKEQLGAHWTDSRAILYSGFLFKSAQIIQALLKSDIK